ncbi:hypothetical protein bcere0017_20920 [Bacillus cereus Rock1-3]|nr:hypothetical protein bcere0017_20920 [Bacillus cereus Rock1-3]
MNNVLEKTISLYVKSFFYSLYVFQCVESKKFVLRENKL